MKSHSEFIVSLRRFKKNDIINIGTKLLWESYKDQEVFKKKFPYVDIEIINRFAPKIIILALATANDFRSKILKYNEFYTLCLEFINIKDPISDKNFLVEESKLIFNNLISFNNKKKKIPSQYLDEKIIRKLEHIIFISRTARQQLEGSEIQIEEFYITFDILCQLNQNTNINFNDQFLKIFNLSPFFFLRSAFCLYAQAATTNGKIIFNNYQQVDKKIKEKLHIDDESLKIVASNISYNENHLREIWHKELLSQDNFYQKFFPTPLNHSPIICMHTSKSNNYLIPSPRLYIRGVYNAIFSRLRKYNKILRSAIGNAIENHIFVILKKIFGNSNTYKISPSPNCRSADFRIDLQDYILIIECKTALTDFVGMSIIAPNNIAEIWGSLYKACTQCSETIKTLDTEKTIVPIILIADHIHVDTISFEAYAHEVNLFRDEGINNITFISWFKFLAELSNLSIEKFICRYNRIKNNPTTSSKVDPYIIQSSDEKSAHNYEFFNEIKEKFFNDFHL